MLRLLMISLVISGLNAVIYDCYSGKPATRKQLEVFIERKNTEYCVIDVKPCDENEFRRADGSCNNLKFPSRGTVRTPPIRLLNPDFSPNYEPRKTKDGKSLPLPRYLRTQLLKEGKVSDLETTQLVSYFILFAINDVNTIHDLGNFLRNTTNCCQPEGKSNYVCTPNMMPRDDPVHRYSGVKCQNLTRPQSFQYFGCVDFGTTPFARINYATPFFDLSIIYGKLYNGTDILRTFEKGLLKTDTENGKIFPPRNTDMNSASYTCLLNQFPQETFCFLHHLNASIGPLLFIILFYRQHNHIAKMLAEINPSWDDNHLYHTAMDINIAIYTQIFFYEMLPVVLGKENMIRDGVLLSSDGFRDVYNEEIPPQITEESIYVTRWFHTVQEADLKLYDRDGFYLRRFPLVNLTTRTGILPLDDNLEQYFQGSFRQYGGGFDHTVDNDIAQRIMGSAQYALDGPMTDLAKGRYFGFPPYIKYRRFCTGRPYKTFDSLMDAMTEERIYRMTELYDNVEDIELMAGIWAEKLIPGGRVPYTMYCVMMEQLKRTLATDRHWYERPNRPHAFTLRQLQAIRKTTVAGVLCAHAEGVTKIQPNAFYKIASDNPLTDCESPKIGKIDLSAWKDSECGKE